MYKQIEPVIYLIFVTFSLEVVWKYVWSNNNTCQVHEQYKYST